MGEALIKPRKDIAVFSGLTDRQYRFVHEYFVHHNGVKAALAAGTKGPKNAAVMACKMLKNPKVRRAIQFLDKKALKDCLLSAEMIRNKIALVLTFKPYKYFRSGGNGGWYATEEQLDDLPDEVHELIIEIQRKTVETKGVTEVLFWIKFMSKDKSLELGARYTLTEKHINDNRHQTNWDDLHSSNGKNGEGVDHLIRKRIELVKKVATDE
jgi:hypothetical protein